MRKQDVVNAVAAQVTMTPRDVRAVLAGIDLVVGEAVMRGEDVTLGFVKFEPVTLPPRVQRLPSGELKELGERRRVVSPRPFLLPIVLRAWARFWLFSTFRVIVPGNGKLTSSWRGLCVCA